MSPWPSVRWGTNSRWRLWRADELAIAMRSARSCPDCAGKLVPALQRFDDFPTSRNPPLTRIIPVIGTVFGSCSESGLWAAVDDASLLLAFAIGAHACSAEHGQRMAYKACQSRQPVRTSVCTRLTDSDIELRTTHQNPLICRSIAKCRRRDSNPRHADYDSRVASPNWLQLAGFPPRYRPYFSLAVAL
jgi:hypothetical protein